MLVFESSEMRGFSLKIELFSVKFDFVNLSVILSV